MSDIPEPPREGPYRPYDNSDYSKKRQVRRRRRLQGGFSYAPIEDDHISVYDSSGRFIFSGPKDEVALKLENGEIRGLYYAEDQYGRHFASMSKDSGVFNYTNTDRSLFLAYVLWFLFGIFGAHRFYLGDKNNLIIGAFYLATGGLFFLGVIFDLFYLPFALEKSRRAPRLF